MTEDEAEAALVALGPQLEWAKVRKDYGYADVDDGCYRIEPSTDLYLQWMAVRWYDAPGVQPYEVGYCTYAAAKAACERHHATGKWE